MSKTALMIKEEVLNQCIQKVEERIYHAEYALQQARDASNDDTKSSAGDKYETTREMMQQDIARSTQQLQEANKEHILLQSIIHKESSVVELGALVRTNMGYFYISGSMGAIDINGEKIFAISQGSPIGQLLKGKKVGESILFNGKTQEILEIF